MKFRFWLFSKKICRRIQVIQNSVILKWLRGTLIFNIIYMTMIVLGVVFVLFLFAPTTANLYYKNSISYLEMGAKEAYGNIYTSKLMLEIENKRTTININDFEVEYNDIIYDNIKELRIDLVVKDWGNFIYLERTDNFMIDTYFMSQNYSGIKNDELVNCLGNRITFNDGVIFYGINAGEYNIRIVGGASLTALDSNGLELFNATELTIRINETEKGAIYTEDMLTLYSVNDFIGYDDDIVQNYYEVIFKDVKYADFTGTGTVFFSLSAVPETYALNDQTVFVHGSEKNSNGLEVSLSLTQDILENSLELTLSGIVDAAAVSEINLFPTFVGWFRDNIYLAPLSLVSIIFGSISLIKKKKEC